MTIFKNNTFKKSLILFGALFLCVMSGACLTMTLYQGKKAPLQEEISGFLVTQDQQQIVFIGKHSHYIFPLKDDLKQILKWSRHSQLAASRLNFVISRGNIINGNYILTFENGATLTADDQSFLSNHGFQESPHHAPRKDSFSVASQLHIEQPSSENDQNYTYHGTLSKGTVYDAGKFELPQLQSFKAPYQLTILYDYASTGQVVGRTLLTPLTVAADGVTIVVGSAIAVVVGIPVLGYCSLAHCH